MAYHVFIERTSDQSAGAIEQVAAAIAARYGLPEAAIANRMAKGRFRVKANIDLKTAAKFAADLEKLGAVCTIVDSSSAGAAPPAMNVAAAPAVAATASRPPAIPSGRVRVRAPAKASPKAATMIAPSSPRSAVGTPPPAAAPTDAPAPGADPSGDYQTGLAAAFSSGPESSQQGLGALEDLSALNADTGEFKLSALDGTDELAEASAQSGASFAPPDAAAFGPPSAGEEKLQLADVPTSSRMPAAVSAPAPAPLPPTAPGSSGGMFAPPDADEMPLALDTVEVTPPVARAPMPAVVAPAPPPTPEASAAGLAIGAADTGAACATHGPFDAKIYVRCPACARADNSALAPGAAVGEPSETPKRELPDFKRLVRERFLEHERTRFAVGIVLVVLLSWIPAKVFWGSRVDSAQAELTAAMQEPRSMASAEPDSWEDYRDIGRAQRAIRESSLFNSRITASLLWIACGVGLGFVWFRKIPWDEF